MKKILFAALTALLLVAVCVVGLIPALSRNDEGVIVADQLNAAGALVDAEQIKASMATKQTAPAEAVAVGTAAQWAAMTSGGTYKLTANITVSGSLGTASAPFGATIYGNGYTVTASAPLFANAGTLTVYDLTVAGTVTGNGAVAAEAATLTAKNVTVTAKVTGTGATGGLVGTVGTLNATNCINLGVVKGGNVAGGLVGTSTASATLENCSNGDDTFGASVSAADAVGGLVGVAAGNSLTVRNCVNYIDLTIATKTVENYVGGIVGGVEAKNAKIELCSNAGVIMGPTSENDSNKSGHGGIVGRAKGADGTIEIKDCLNVGNVTISGKGTNHNGVGGILGFDLYRNTTITGCVNMGVVGTAGVDINPGSGGILGQIEYTDKANPKTLTVKDCVNSGNVPARRAGGIIGIGETINGVVLVENCSNSGAVSSTKNYAAGIAARLEPQVAPTTAKPYPVSFINCVNTGTVTTGGGNCAGGIYGYANTAGVAIYFEGCRNLGRITNMTAGGIAASLASVVMEDCYNAGAVSGSGNAGGMVGLATGDVSFTDCVNDGDITAANGHAAGMVAAPYAKQTFLRCTNNGDILVTATSGSYDAGGLAGRGWTDGGKRDGTSVFTDCVNTGNVKNCARMAGGLVGWNDHDTTFTNCVNTGNVIGITNVGGFAGQITWKPMVTSCVNTGYIEGGQIVGGFAGSVSSSGHDGGKFIGNVNIGNVHNTGAKSTDKSHGAGGICGYVWGVGHFYYNAVTGDVTGNFPTDRTTLYDKSACGAICSYQNNNTGEYVFNYFTGTLNAKNGTNVLLKTTPGESCLCDNSSWGSTYLKWNYTVNDYPFYTEGECSLNKGDVILFDPNNSAIHNQHMVYDGWLVTAEDVANGTLMNTLNTVTTQKVSGFPNGAYVQVKVCDKINMPVFNATADLFVEWCGIDHEYTVNKSDAEMHWTECTCGEISPAGKEAHTLALCTDATFHWNECAACGYATEKQEHTVVNAYDAKEHWSSCSTCGVEITREKHAFDTIVASPTADYFHTFGCKCGATSGQDVPHEYTAFVVTDEGHSMACVCGAISPSGMTAHKAEEKLYSDAEYHWNQCVCGYVMNKTAHAHADGKVPTCVSKAVCETCGVEYGTVDAAAHTREIQWTLTETTHYAWYPCCGAEVETAAHVWHDTENKCTVCEMTCEHAGGEATCVAKAVCEYCGKSYGNRDFDNHKNVRTEATCSAQTQCDDCGEFYGELNPENHAEDCVPEYVMVGENGATHHTQRYSSCLKVIAVEEHTVGTVADCDSKTICAVCQLAYGEVDLTNHDAACGMENMVWNTEHDTIATTHKGTYPACGQAFEAPHEFADGACTVCGYVCVAHVENGETVAVPTTDATNHENRYVCCGGLASVSAHTYENGVCADCGYTCAHAGEFTYAKVSETEHSKTCTVCGLVVNEAHTESTAATCQSKAHCDVCDSDYGEFDATKHSWSETYVVEEERHYKTCNYGCDQIFEESAHAYTEYDVHNSVHQMACVCGDILEGSSEAHEMVEKRDETNHWLECKCGKITKVEAHVFVYEHDDANHWLVCSCGLISGEVEAHTESTAATCQSKAHCDVCGNDYGEFDADAHQWSETYVVEANRHYQTCDHGCGEINEGAHAYNEYRIADSIHWMMCVCGKESTENTREVHTLVAKTDSEYHWTECFCGYVSEKIAHVFVYECDDTNHWLICSCGVTSGEAVAHTTSSAATCLSKAHCDVCGNDFGAIDPANHAVDTTTLKCDAENGQHYYIHNCCEAEVADSRVACSVGENGTAATCLNAATCGVCGQTFGTVDATNHASTETTLKTDAENGKHYYTHNCCEAEVVDSRVACSVGENGTAATCLNAATCGVCGQTFGTVDATNHASTETTLKTDAENGKHYYTHNCCEAEVADSRVACSAGENGVAPNCQTVGTCGVCGQTFGAIDATNHASTETTLKTDAENGQHYYTHNCCEAEVADSRVACSAGENGVAPNCQTVGTCGVCGQTFGTIDATNHASAETTLVKDTENGQHYYTHNCCEAEVADSRVACSAGENGTAPTCQAAGVCGVCGQTFGEVDPDAHTWSETYEVEEERHYKTCVNGCGAIGEEAAHVYDRYAVTDSIHWMMCVCGKENPENTRVTHEMVDKFDENNHWSECVCGKSTEVQAHGFAYESNADGHIEKCACGATRGTEMAHTFDTATGLCTVCEYACLHDGAFRYVTDETDATLHDVYCAVCGMLREDNVQHGFEDNHFVADGEFHWVACLCGTKQDAANGGLAHNGGTATCTARAICETCGASYGELDPENHAELNGFDYWTDPEDLSKHVKAYDCCGAEVATEGHTYENGECKFCGADCVHTGGTATCKDKAVCTLCGLPYGEVSTEAHVYDNACDNACNGCGATRTVTHTFGDWTVTTAPTTEAKGVETRSCSVCKATETRDIAQLAPEEKKLGTGVIVAIVAGSVVAVGAIVIVAIWVVKSRAAGTAAAETVSWRTKKYRKAKWKKRK